MKKLTLTFIVALFCVKSFAAGVGLPVERLALPEVSGGEYLVCIWDESLQQWKNPSFESYDHAGTYEFQVPAWDKWYWIGLWDVDKGEYVYGKWIGHFVTD